MFTNFYEGKEISRLRLEDNIKNAEQAKLINKFKNKKKHRIFFLFFLVLIKSAKKFLGKYNYF